MYTRKNSFVSMRAKLFHDYFKVFTLPFIPNIRRNLHRQRLLSTQALPKNVKPYDTIPGLSSLPIIGPLHHFLPVIGEIGPDVDLFSKLGDLTAKYGPIIKMKGVFSRADFVILFEPEHFEQVYRAEETYPLRPGFQTITYYREVLRESTFEGANGLTTSQGPQWRDMRTKVNPAMLKPKLIKLYAPGLEDIADEMIGRISRLKDQGDYLQQNFELEMTKWSMESVALVGLGTRLGCLQDNLPKHHPASKLMQCSKDIMDLTFKLEFKPSLWKYMNTPNFKKLVKVYDTQWEVSTMYINEAKKSIESRTHEVLEEDKSIIEKLLAIDEKVAIMMGNEMLLAGIDTVAFAIMCLLYNLAANPHAQEKLRQEIRADNNSNRYLRACLKESLRKWHVIPANLRRTSKDHVVAGYHIPVGVDVIAPNQYLSNHEKYYPRPKEFLPERWLADKNDPIYHGNAHPMVNLPFGFGVRSCIGRRIAELEIDIFIKKLLNTFKLTWEGPPTKVKTKLMSSLDKPFRIKFESVD